LLEWVDSMANQLTPDVVQQLASAGTSCCAGIVLGLWNLLAAGWAQGIYTPQSALQMLRPGVMRLAQRMALLT
jgi:hypothetical protein